MNPMSMNILKSNKMKLSNIFLTLLFLVITTGCNDSFMDKFPPDKVNDGNFWNTPEDLKSYANGYYTFSALGGYSTDNASDNQAYRDKDSYLWNEWTQPISGGGWAKGDWANIRSLNKFLVNYQRAEGDPDVINIYLGEILTFKALEYFNKVVTFGDVPWLTKDLLPSSPELYFPRDSRKVVMDSINSCLDRAISYLPEISNEGRLTKYAALAIKSRVCLFEGTYRKYHNLGDHADMLRQSANASLEVINSNLFEVYNTGNPEEDYHAFFQLQDMTSVKEAIFSVRYLADKKQHNRVRSVRESGAGMTKDFVESYLCRTDGLPISLSPDYRGDATFMDEFENRDYRMKQTIYTPDRPIFITETGDEEFENAPIFTTHVFTGYRMYKMYSPLAADNEYEKCTIDDCIYRYAEVLLNYAEAKAELGELDQTVLDISINKLRERAGMPDMAYPIPFTDPNWPAWEVSISPELNEIRRERRIELASEGLRWRDLCRWKAGKLLENPKTYLGARDPDTGNYRDLYPGNTRVWMDRMYLRPIPTDELRYNPLLKPQNPGWNE